MRVRRAGGVKGGEAAERSEGPLDATEHRTTLPIDGAIGRPLVQALGQCRV
jgi:hypothetical protein